VQKLLLAPPAPNSTGAYSGYATLALGSALALFLYPHSPHRHLSASSGHVIRRNAAMLPGYTFMLGLLALFGFFVIAAGVDKLPDSPAASNSSAIISRSPRCCCTAFHPGSSASPSPQWALGLVPAAIMAIAAANLYTRNIHREFINRNRPTSRNRTSPNLASLLVKAGH